MTERTFEIGGEVLRVGSTVIVFDGNRHREKAVTAIGTSRIHIESLGVGKPVPYDKKTRRSLQGAYGSYFRTKTEVAATQRRDLVRARLRDLGLEVRVAGNRDFSEPYSTELLEEVAGMLQAALPNQVDSQRS